jgi:hypothetical protein
VEQVVTTGQRAAQGMSRDIQELGGRLKRTTRQVYERIRRGGPS